MMRRFGKHCGIGLRRQKIEPAINLKRIRIDNLRADFLRDISRQLGFTSRGGSDDEENFLCVVTVKPSLFSCHSTYFPKTKSGDARICAASPDQSHRYLLTSHLMLAGLRATN